MRKNQVEIKINRFGDEVPYDYGKSVQTINIYADSNNLFEALSVAYSEAIKELQRHEPIPSFGRVDISNNYDDNGWYKPEVIEWHD